MPVIDTAHDGRRSEDDERIMATVGDNLRRIRRSRGWSLDDACRADGCPVKPSCLGAYERGTRTVSVPMLMTLSQFYGVPIEALLGAESRRFASRDHRPLVVDLTQLESAPPEAAKLRRFVRSIAVERGDFNGRVLTLRRADLPAIAVLVGVSTPEAAIEQLDAWSVLLIV